jgi:putative toxin-antitoxin system antitoxin component (TIGR02293 family)
MSPARRRRKAPEEARPAEAPPDPGESLTSLGFGARAARYRAQRGAAEEPAAYGAMLEPIPVVGNMLGGSPVLGRPIFTELDLAAAVRAGIPTRAVRLVWKKKIVSPAETYAHIVPRRTFEHREKTGRLTPEQSDRLARILRLTALAERAFGTAEKAAAWLRRKTRPLGDCAPLSLLDSDAGAKAVEDLLGRIEHGIAA